MEDFIKTAKEIKNKTGKIIERITRIQPKSKKGKISLNDVDKIYKKLRIQSKKENKKFMIKVMTYDGFKTLNGFDYDEDSLKYVLEDYYSSMPSEERDKYNHFFFIEIISR
jgi:hypothetical protein